MSGELKLTAAQEQAITSLSQNRALLSGAGCGKTFVLARRFTELLLRALAEGNVENPLLGLVALTFTEKAALEMQHRIRAFLRERLAAAGSTEDRALLRQWLEVLPEARISTIHSFCAALLRGHAIEAGLDPDFRVAAEQIVTDRMQAEAAEQAVLSAVESGNETVAKLLAANSFNALVGQVRRLLADRERIALDANDNPAATLQQWTDALTAAQQGAGDRIRRNAAFRDALSQLESYTCSDPADKLHPCYEDVIAAAHAVLNQPFAECNEAMTTLANIKPGNVGSKTAWNAPPKEVRDAMKAVGAAVADEAVFAGPLNEQDDHAARILATVTQLARNANRRYAAAKREQGLVDFADLIISARDVLAASPALAKAIGEGIRQILIDEAQDTDATQIGLLLRLLGGEDGQLAAVGEGRLFVVGDAKQSIYRFRGAQVEVFQRLCEGLGRDRQIDLARSFRTHPGGVAFVNHVFGNLLGDGYSPIEAHREESPAGPAVDILLAGDHDARDTQHRQAAVVAEHIEAMLREGKQVWDSDAKIWRAVRPGDIAILFSRMTVSGPYERELQKCGVDYYVVAGSGFFRQQEVYDVLNALRVIDNPFDDIAFFGLLRSGMVGLDDNALMHIAETHRPPYLPTLNIDALAERLSEPQLAALRRAKHIVQPLSHIKDAVGIGELVERVLAATGYEAALLSQWKGKRMAGNVRQLLAQARAAEGQLSLAEFIAQMDEFTLSDTRYEQAGTSGEDEDVVRLMTIHKAKGLEFPVVIVPDLNAGRQGPGGPTLHRLDWGLTTKLQFSEADDDIEPRSYAIARQLEDRDDQAETLRRYYVALTRHRDHLVLVGDNERLKDGRFKGGDCFLNALDGVFELSEAVEAVGNAAEIHYGPEGGYVARIRVVEPASVRTQRASDSPGAKLLSRAADGGSLGGMLLKDARGPNTAPSLPLVGPLPAELGRVELATTALTEFEACPALYRWRYELRAPTQQLALEESLSQQPQASRAKRSDIMDPFTFGTSLHRCMELLDVRRPASAESLLRQAAADMEIDDATVIRIVTQEFQPMLARFLASDLAADLRDAEIIHRELDFTTEAGLATLRGQIDLLYRRNGVWHVVDYKSDRITGDPSAKLDRYSLQLLIYADAVRRFTGEPAAPADASLHFLRTGDVCTIPINADQLIAARSRIDDLIRRLITSRRTGSFTRCGRDSCDFCRQPHLAHVTFEQHAGT